MNTDEHRLIQVFSPLDDDCGGFWGVILSLSKDLVFWVFQLMQIVRKATAVRLIWVFYILFLSAPGFSFAEEKPVGKIIGIIGTVEILVGEPVAQVKKGEAQQASAEVWEKVKKKQPIYTKDTFRTGRKSRLKILFEDKSLMALGPKTRMSVESYLYKPKDKLRQGVIGMAHGLSMYIVNKSQKNKKSSFRIVSPTGNLAARGTQGYISASNEKTLIANQAGTVSVSNSDPNVGMERKSQRFEFEEGFEPFFSTAGFDEGMDFFAQTPGGNEVPMGPMTKSTILKGQPPSPPVPLTPGELQTIRNVVLAKVGGSSKNKGLIKVEEKKTKKKKKKKKQKKSKEKSATSETSESSESEESSDSEETTEESSESEETVESEEPVGSEESSESDEPVGSEETAGTQESTGEVDAGGDSGFDSGFMSEFTEGAVPEGSFGTTEDFSTGVDVFDDSSTESCSG